MTLKERVEELYERGWPGNHEVLLALCAVRVDTLEEAAKVAMNCELERPAMEEGPLKDEWTVGVADASMAIAAAIRVLAAGERREG